MKFDYYFCFNYKFIGPYQVVLRIKCIQSNVNFVAGIEYQKETKLLSGSVVDEFQKKIYRQENNIVQVTDMNVILI